jgi:two-component system, NarL family, sensor kinase
MEAPAGVAGLVPSKGHARFPLRLSPAGGPEATASHRTFAPPNGARAPRKAPRGERGSTELSLLGQAFVWARDSLGWTLPPEARSQRESRQALEVRSAAMADLMQGLFDTLHEDVALLDRDGRVIAVNGAWCATLPDPGDDGSPRGGLGLHYLDLCRGISSDLSSDRFRHGVRDVLGRRATAFAHEFVVSTPAGQRRRQARITQLSWDGAALLVAIHEDESASSASAHAADDLLTAQDEERQRIAMELHDSTSQHLVVLGFGVARLRRMLGAAADDVLEEMSSSITEVVKEIRILSFLKRPPGLQRDGFAAAIGGFVRGFGVRTGLEARLTSVGDVDDTPPNVQHAAFRIVQESLSNVYRHAGATLVEVALRRQARALVIQVADNGRGIAGLRQGLSDVSLGVGIVGMQTRAGQLGGRLALSNGVRGAIVTVTLPLAVRKSGARAGPGAERTA